MGRRPADAGGKILADNAAAFPLLLPDMLRVLAVFALALALPALAGAQGQSATSSTPPVAAAEQPEPTPPAVPPLGEADLKAAARIDQLTIPTPGELLAATGKVAQPNWQTTYRPPIPTVYTSRAQIALNLGGLIADGYLAVQAADAQQVKNTGKDITSLAKALGVSENVLGRGNSIGDFAERNEWGTLKEELEATQNEVKLAMREQQDEGLVVLVTLGGWIRGTQIVTTWLSDNFDPEVAKLLRQPGIVAFMRGQLGELPAKVRDEKLVKAVDERLASIEEMVSFPRDQVPTKEQIDRLRVEANQLVKTIVDKE